MTRSGTSPFPLINIKKMTHSCLPKLKAWSSVLAPDFRHFPWFATFNIFFFLQTAIGGGSHFHPLQLLLKLSVVAKVTKIVIQQTRTEHTWLFQMCSIHMVVASWMELRGSLISDLWWLVGWLKRCLVKDFLLTGKTCPPLETKH